MKVKVGVVGSGVCKHDSISNIRMIQTQTVPNFVSESLEEIDTCKENEKKGLCLVYIRERERERERERREGVKRRERKREREERGGEREEDGKRE